MSFQVWQIHRSMVIFETIKSSTPPNDREASIVQSIPHFAKANSLVNHVDDHRLVGVWLLDD
jgi:hypothetical protein